MERKVIRLGGSSVGVVIPSEVAKYLGISQGDIVEVNIRPIKAVGSRGGQS